MEETVYRTHLQKMRAAMLRRGVDLMFLNFGADFTYLTGIVTPDHYTNLRLIGDWITGVMFGVEQDPVLILQEDFARPAQLDQTWIQERRELPPDDPDPDAFLARVVAEFHPAGKTIAVSKMLWGQTLLALQAAAPGAVFVANGDPLMDEVRSCKDAHELGLMRRASEITTEIMDEVVRQLKPGVTPLEVKLDLLARMERRGVEPSFHPGVSGVNRGSDPRKPRDPHTVLLPGSTLSFDFGVRYRGYCSDYGRTVFIGEPQPEALAAYRCITAIVQEVTALLGAGRLTPASAYALGCVRAREAGLFAGYYQWGLGHAIGLEVHEWPWLRAGADRPFEAGMCLCVEPKIGRAGEYYTRCEDVILVGETCGEVLTRFTYEPIVVS